jgi:tRNA(Ile)-lysidine synthase
MPLLETENPRLAENLSAMALLLRQDEEYLQQAAGENATLCVEELRQLDPALRIRILERFLKENGVKEPEYRHLCMAEGLVFSQKPSARAAFPGGVTIERCYDRLRPMTQSTLDAVQLHCPGEVLLPQLGLKVICREATEIINTDNIFTLAVAGPVWLRSRMTGDEIRLKGGTKSLKKVFIDRKIPASQRASVPVLADEQGVLAVYGISADQNRLATSLPAMQFVFEKV